MKLVIIYIILEAVFTAHTVFGYKRNSIRELMSNGNPSKVQDEPGAWVPWNSAKDTVPENAVVAGYNPKNETFYVIKVDVWGDGTYQGVVPGRFAPSKNLAECTFRGEKYKSKYFHILTRKTVLWTNSIDDPKKLIVGGWLNKTPENKIYICRDESRSNALMPGKYENGKCVYLFNGEEVESKKWTILRKP